MNDKRNPRRDVPPFSVALVDYSGHRQQAERDTFNKKMRKMMIEKPDNALPQ
jgi:hypothetical protein